MNLEGSIRTTGPGAPVVRGLSDAATLAAIAPAGFEFRKVQDGAADFLIRRGFGPVTLTLQGTMALSGGEGGVFRLEIKAAHLIGGRVGADLRIETLDGAITWAGTLTSQGLAGRLLGERSAEANTIMTNLFLRLRDHVEGVPTA